MLLTIDIGNSYVTCGGYKGEKLEFITEMATNTKASKEQYAVWMKNITALYNVDMKNVCGAIISSVVPELTSVLKNAVKLICGKTPLVVGPGVKSGINITIDDPAQLGADMAACAVGVISRDLYPCVIYDLGTASTIGVIDNKKRFVGVIIAAGVGTTLEVFTDRTALLPHVSIEAPKEVIGRNTIQSMQSGLVYGTAAMLDGLSERIEEKLGYSVKRIATGSMAEVIVPHCKYKAELNKYLLFEGLREIYNKNVQVKKQE